MRDLISELSEQDLSDLLGLADGTLPPGRRAEVESRVAASPELQALVERQRKALAATRMLADDEPPESLRAALVVRRPRRRRAPRVALAAATAVAAAIVAALLLSGGPGGPSVADAARLAAQPVTGAPPASTGTRLSASVGGVSFPDFARPYGWRAVGIRHGEVDGRPVTVVYYGKGTRRLAYAIVSGPGLKPPSGEETTKSGVQYDAARLDGRLAVTWQRGGHTCVLIGDATAAELLTLASWQLTPAR